jgi:hypothetical protein
MPPLTSAQLTALKNDIAADGTINTVPQTSDNADMIAGLYNQDASPTFWVWRTNVPSSEYTGNAGLVWTEVDNLTVGKARIFEWMTAQLTRNINAADPNVQSGIQEAFSASSTSRAHLLVLGRRPAKRIEKLLATGPGSTASPATMTFEGTLRYPDIENAWAQP